MQSKLWAFRDINLSQRDSLVQALSISPATASLFLARGVTSPDEATSWMSLQSPHDPFLIPDMEQAVERLHRAVTTREPICFYGDYDVDGIMATSVYMSFFGGWVLMCAPMCRIVCAKATGSISAQSSGCMTKRSRCW